MDFKQIKFNKKSSNNAAQGELKPILKRPRSPSPPSSNEVVTCKARSTSPCVIFNPLIAVAEYSTNEPTTTWKNKYEELIQLCCFTEDQDKLLSDDIADPDIVEMTDHIDTVIPSMEEKDIINYENVLRETSPSFNHKKITNNNTERTGVTNLKQAIKVSGDQEINQTESRNNLTQALQVKPGTIPETLPVKETLLEKEDEEPIINEVQNFVTTMLPNVDNETVKENMPVKETLLEKEDEDPIINEVQNFVTTMLTDVDDETVKENLLNILTNKLSVSKPELQTKKNNVMLTRRRLFDSEEGSSSSVEDKESRNEALLSQLNAQSDAGADIVACISMLRFMGQPWECKWECLTDDTWTFLLLHERIRLTVRLPDYSLDEELSSVPDTCDVTHVALEEVPGDMTLSMHMCVFYAVIAMRVYLVGVANIKDLPELLHRCSALARRAYGWMSAIHKGYYNIDYKGAPYQLSFKVANKSFNCEWTVTMRIKTKVNNETGEVFPFVGDVQVTSESQVQDAPDANTSPNLSRIRENVPLDWDHVPRTLWRIFKHLKNLKRPYSSKRQV